jgi:hypothetical protein
MSRKLMFLLPSLLLLTVGLFAQGVDPGTANLTHSWTFDDGTTNDQVGTAHGTLMEGAIIEDGALVTADLTQYMEMNAEDVGLNTYTEFTCEAWYASFADMNASYTMFFYFGGLKNAMGYNGFFLTPARGDNFSRAAISCWADTPYQGETGANGPEYDDGTLHHMVATLNESQIALYMDGVETGRNDLSATNTIDALEPLFCYLSKSGYTSDATWRGYIYEFNIYNRVLTDDEINFLSLQDPTVGVDEQPTADLPAGFGLLQNYPNPFNPGTTIPFNLQKRSRVTITVFDMLGRQVAGLLDEMRDAGQSSVQFDGSNLAGGMYLCKMQIDGRETLTRKMMLMK